jgi:hypothetical protein
MRVASRSGLIATTLTMSAIAAPGAHASGLLSGPRPDPGRRSAGGAELRSDLQRPSRRCGSGRKSDQFHDRQRV